eukprot:GDKJ01034492.1.p2 GENE.GDKJ01034492.1~~GDKJ01034492.1.p2  ORF type:complete len:108 (-),score=6.86 GDKJ01034492.1:291-614(-)
MRLWISIEMALREVYKIHLATCGSFSHHDVTRGQIAMDNVPFVDLLDRLDHAEAKAANSLKRELITAEVQQLKDRRAKRAGDEQVCPLFFALDQGQHPWHVRRAEVL